MATIAGYCSLLTNNWISGERSKTKHITQEQLDNGYDIDFLTRSTRSLFRLSILV